MDNIIVFKEKSTGVLLRATTSEWKFITAVLSEYELDGIPRRFSALRYTNNKYKGTRYHCSLRFGGEYELVEEVVPDYRITIDAKVVNLGIHEANSCKLYITGSSTHRGVHGGACAPFSPMIKDVAASLSLDENYDVCDDIMANIVREELLTEFDKDTLIDKVNIEWCDIELKPKE